MRDADLAMYRAKALGKGRFELFSPDLYVDALRTLGIRNDLARAFERSQLELHFQPIVSLATGAVEAFEALIRWRHPTLGMIMPAEFLPLAEASGASAQIGRWVLMEACAAAAAWQSTCCPHVGVNVNVSPQQLAGPGIVDDVTNALDASALSPRLLTLELTEMAVEDPLSAADRLAQFRNWGVTIAIDDFGTGFSTLARVRELPVQELKIDRSLIETADEKLAAAVIQLGKALGLRLIVEGVETQEQLERVRALGCDAAQGYLLGRPMPVSALPTFIEAHRESLAGFAPGAPASWAGGRFTTATLPQGIAGL
jgi:EAL domain-containing protein (putative c-di-GMP-specific phosphodiesterase class I)